MLELFVIFSKGGIVLWWFQGASQILTGPVNSLIKDVVLQGKQGSVYNHERLALKYSLDNQFELVFVAAYQAELALSYVDKLLTDVQREFRDRYKNQLQCRNLMGNFDFTEDFTEILKGIEEESRIEASKPKQMRTFDQSAKSKKTVASMIIDPKKRQEPSSQKQSAKGKENKTPLVSTSSNDELEASTTSENEVDSSEKSESVEQKRKEFMMKLQNKGSKTKNITAAKPDKPEKKGKQATKWEFGGNSKDAAELDVFNTSVNKDSVNVTASELHLRGSGIGELKDLEEEEEQEVNNSKARKSKSSSSGGILGMFKSLTMGKALTKEAVAPALDKMREHLIGKNVAADIAEKLCNSVADKLEGKVIGTFDGVAATVKSTLEESCVQILTPKRRINILRDAMEARQRGQPYCITFCGVNGVGKSTNLSKVAFWLIENGLTVMIAACDTFRAGAVEQLRTHTKKLNTIHSPADHGGKQMVELYEKGYDKDAASVAMSALSYARDKKVDVVLIDTAGRMQDNAPLMVSLAKLIKVNQPDLVLFVGEALVGNEAVDQLVKFNQALADHSQQENPHLIDGIVLTKFDTIDDKVGAAISMTYITGQPIVFVGTGQTYTDLKALNARAVVSALMKS